MLETTFKGALNLKLFSTKKKAETYCSVQSYATRGKVAYALNMLSRCYKHAEQIL